MPVWLSLRPRHPTSVTLCDTTGQGRDGKKSDAGYNVTMHAFEHDSTTKVHLAGMGRTVLAAQFSVAPTLPAFQIMK